MKRASHLFSVTSGICLPTAALLLLLGSQANAQLVTAGSYSQYGHAVNGYTGTNSGNPSGNYVPGPYCAATSTANSLTYLANRYPALSGLLMGSTTATRDAIVNMEIGSGSAGTSPSNNAAIWNSKVNYIDSAVNPSLITIEGYIDPSFGTMGYTSSSNAPTPNFSAPTETWLQQQIEAGQDVEIAFSWATSAAPMESGSSSMGGSSTASLTYDSHMVTLTGIDSMNDMIQYLDPNNPSMLLSASFSMSSGSLFGDASSNVLSFYWNNMNNPATTVGIDEAWAESPTALAIPEPATFTLFAALGTSSASIWQWRRRRRRCSQAP